MVAPFDIQPTLTGEKVIVRPLTADDWDALFAVASDPAIWAMHPYKDRYKEDVFKAFFADALASRGAFAIIDQASCNIIGSTRFANYVSAANEIEIGWTFFATSHWRGGYNREVKALMLRHAFPHVEKIVFRIGAENWRSRTAVERLGGVHTASYVLEHEGRVNDYVTYKLSAKDAAQGALGQRLGGGND